MLIAGVTFKGMINEGDIDGNVGFSKQTVEICVAKGDVEQPHCSEKLLSETNVGGTKDTRSNTKCIYGSSQNG